MYLTVEEQRMYAGEEGTGVQAAMELLVSLGEVYDAPRLIKIVSAHATARTYKVGKEHKIQWMQDLVDRGARFRVLTTVNPGQVDFEQYREMGLPEKLVEQQKMADMPYVRLGVAPIDTCLPYLHGNLPRLGEHFSWGGSSGQIFANSVLGARGNRDGAPLVIASAITGRTAEYGLHLDENRRGQVLVDASQLDLQKVSLADYAAMGYYLGYILLDKIPVFSNLPRDINQEELRALTAGMPAGGAITLCHVVGVTPEAPTLEAAFGARNPEEKIGITPAEIKKGYELLTTAKSDTVDAVVFGCPHCSLTFIIEIAKMLGGRRVNSGVKLWISTSKHIQVVAQQMGLVDVIRKAGGLVLAGVCVGPGASFELMDGVKTVATSNSRAAYYIPGASGVGVIFGDVSDCIEAAITGKWRGQRE
jgi:predicted aconitase